MRVTQALSQSLLHRFTRRAPLLAGAVCVALVVGGCASNTTLGEKSNEVKETGTTLDASKGAQTTTITKLQKFMWFFSPYRPDIQQGNFVSEEMLSQLKTGMTREQVRFIFGTALLADPFHADRWDYAFRMAKGNGEITTSRVIVFFDKDGKVARWEGGNLPTEKDYIARIAGPAPKIKKDLNTPDARPVGNTATIPAGADNSAASPVGVTVSNDKK
ncbi:outer membrane protein assembly factor BamE [Duganella sp. BJB488]|uniref:outer membrane protein assembly factor BamE n=1 Tax=unclassified Duganella TaxID=2636909 RepID=UPI000E3435EB|nr:MULTISPECIES: outer membrane protein assembly factor BamE [unclassified Duganella]RFP16896.1 outer membrane protein assembly factor BamE [Duganella sp. BJB489]RFP20686.1 outer membrane protein assembly factor BamE [Duganella sp. BJB488]RFP32259.1 outer membrane protein assembly factor BamE [Duganella sp. BJB480]